MAVVVPLFLPLINTNQAVTITSLYNPTPGFQVLFDPYGMPQFISPANANRNELGISFGFPHTQGINIGTSAATLVPSNAYAVVAPSQAGYPVANDAVNSLVLLDVDVAPIQPGLSRLRIDYTDVNNVQQTSYFDMPYWENWDIHPSQIQEIVDYIEGATNFFQDWLNRIDTGIQFMSRHIWLKGLAVSGGISTTQANMGLAPAQAAHSLPPGFGAMMRHQEAGLHAQMKLAGPFLPPVIPQIGGAKTFVQGITAVYSTIYPGQSIELYTEYNAPMDAQDKITILGTALDTTIDFTLHKYMASIPNNLAFTSIVPINITNQKHAKSPSINLTLKAKPKIKSMSGPNNEAYGAPGDNFTIKGTDFGPASTVTFTPGITGTILSWEDNQILGIVPANVVPGNATVTTINGDTSSVFFNVYNPYVSVDYQAFPKLAVLTATQAISAQGEYNNTAVASQWSIVTDSLNVGAGNTTYGNITANGVYTAPAFVSTPTTLSLVSNYRGPLGPHVAQMSVVLLPSANALTITPSQVTVAPAFNEKFILTNSGSPVTNVQWYVNGILGGAQDTGFIDFNGIYSAPNAIPRTQTVYVTAVAYIGGNPEASHAAVRVGND